MKTLDDFLSQINTSRIEDALNDKLNEAILDEASLIGVPAEMRLELLHHIINNSTIEIEL